MSGSLLVGVAEVVVYSGYIRRLGEAKQKEGVVEEVKEIVETWVIGGEEAEKKKIKSVALIDREDQSTLRERIRQKYHQPDIMCRDFYKHSSDKRTSKTTKTYRNRNIIIVPTIWCVPSTYLLRALQEKEPESELLSRRLSPIPTVRASPKKTGASAAPRPKRKKKKFF